MAQSPNMSRADFLKTSALALSLPLLTRFDAQAKPIKNVGLQLYTLRNELSKDPDSTLKRVAEIGYKEVETFGYNDGKFFGKTPQAFKEQLKSLGMTSPSGHYMPNQLKSGWEKIVEDANTIGQKYMACAYIMPADRKKADDYKGFVDLFNKAAETCQKAGIQFVYHNHDFEFQPLDGQLGYDIILKGTDPKMVKMELDLYWTTIAGKDPVELFKQNPGRFPLVHMKDIAKTEKREFAEVGTGSIDFQRILDAAKTGGVKHYFVEQDAVTKGTPLEAIAVSFKNMQKLSV
ncbi:sugar phosphate isomerase/epimerase family protein [Fibrella forsythiae]|uniref:Sugar phosphate isomerase/epimerase n=1 Tax=Fibrella forsythiae TaxID=2817061 RepID=A0ABS3JQU5_9BACT|nr:sugar phosphate isomerase/epimerase [Fibrella forsythiae]MBO0952384.1 sugar phosphate isomerase/epimerase [Fibrella forsythiae]